MRSAWAAISSALIVTTGCVESPPSAREVSSDSAALCAGAAAQSLDELYPTYFAGSRPTGCDMSGCHGTGAGGLKLQNAHELWQATVGKPSQADPGMSRIEPGDPWRSYLYRNLLPTAVDRMPQGGPYLDEAAIAAIATWICAGAPEPGLPPPPADGGGGSPGPVITSFAPASGVVGTSVTITGSGFLATPSDDVVAFGGIAATVTAASATALGTTVPSGALTGRITVTVAGLVATSATDFLVVSPNPVPTLASVSPNQVTAGAPDTTLALLGGGFVALSTAELDGVAMSTTVTGAGALSFVVPATQLASAGNHGVSVANPGPGGGTSGGRAFVIVNPAPAVTSLSPTAVVVGSGALTLTVYGSGFVAASHVTLDGSLIAASTWTPTRLTVPVTAALVSTVGMVSVIVTNAGPGGGASAPLALSVGNPAPTLTSMTPTSIVAGSGAAVLTLTGSGFISGSEARLDGANLVVTSSSATQILASVSAASTAQGGTHSVTVVNASPGGGASGLQTLTINNPAPTLTSISPTSVATNGAAFDLSVSGSGFNGASTVSFNGAAVATTYVSPTGLFGAIPTIPTGGSYLITVVNPAPGGGTSASATLSAAVVTTPTITGLSPSPGPANSSFTLTVTGSGYACAGTGCEILGLGASPLTPSTCSSTQLVITVPASAAGSYTVQVRNVASGSTSPGVSYSLVTPNPVPVLTALSPDPVAVGSAAFMLSASGSSFVVGASLSLNGTARATTFVPATQVDAAVLAAEVSLAGSYPVVVANPGPGGGASGTVTLSVVAANPVPTIASLTPASLGAGSGAGTITIAGTGFVSSSSAAFNGSSRTTTFVSSSQLTLSLLAADTQTAGDFLVTVTNPPPGGGTSSSYTLSIIVQNPVPSLASLSPTGANAGGAAFTLTANGASFISSSVVSFDGLVKSTTYVSPTQLTAAISSADIANGGSYPVEVVTPAPGGGTSATQSFAVNNPAPAITSIFPSAATVGSGAFSLSVAGTGFVPSSAVLLDGSGRTTHYVNSTQVTADILAGDDAAIGTHTVSVVNPGPGGGTSGGATLTVASQPNPTPTISSLSPCGAVAGAAAFTLTVNGTGFATGVSATFAGSAVTATLVSANQVTAAIPAALVASAPAGNAAAVVLTNLGPGGGASNTAYFGIAGKSSTLAANVQPVFTASCLGGGCHITGSAAPMSLESGKAYGTLVGVTSSGCPATLRVLACGPLRSQSTLVDKILATGANPACSGSAMPKAAPLSAAEKQAIIDWVAQGAPP